MNDYAESHVSIKVSLGGVILEILSCWLSSSWLHRSWDKGLGQCSITYDFRRREKQILCKPECPAESANVGVSVVSCGNSHEEREAPRGTYLPDPRGVTTGPGHKATSSLGDQAETAHAAQHPSEAHTGGRVKESHGQSPFSIPGN